MKNAGAKGSFEADGSDARVSLFDDLYVTSLGFDYERQAHRRGLSASSRASTRSAAAVSPVRSSPRPAFSTSTNRFPKTSTIQKNSRPKLAKRSPRS